MPDPRTLSGKKGQGVKDHPAKFRKHYVVVCSDGTETRMLERQLPLGTKIPLEEQGVGSCMMKSFPSWQHWVVALCPEGKSSVVSEVMFQPWVMQALIPIAQ